MSTSIPYVLLDNQQSFDQAMHQNDAVEWISLDTEFVGERRFEPLLCLIQLTTPLGNYLVDALKVRNLQGLLDIITNPAIVKITHAGENDYRIFFDQFNILPVNVWDTQIVAGFIGYSYPTAFNKLVSSELNIHLSKHSAVTDWERRPFSNNQLQYALNDVIHLPGIWKRQIEKLKKQNRLAWATEEMERLCLAESYFRSADTEALNSNTLNGLNLQKQVFLLRLFRWRWAEAQKRNISKEAILAVKHFGPVVRAIDAGMKVLLENRLLPDKIVHEHYPNWEKFWNTPITDEEEALIRTRKQLISEDSDAQITKDLLHLLVKYRCNEAGVAHTLVLDKSELSPVKAPVFDDDEHDWRKELLGPELMEWLHRRDPIQIELKDGHYEIKMK